MFVDVFFYLIVAVGVVLVGGYFYDGLKDQTGSGLTPFDRLEGSVIPLILLCPISWVVALLAG